MALELQRVEAREFTYAANTLRARFNEMEPTVGIQSRPLRWSNQMTLSLVVMINLTSRLL